MAEVRSDCVGVFGPISALRDLDESTDSPAISRLDLGPNPSGSSAKDFCHGLLARVAQFQVARQAPSSGEAQTSRRALGPRLGPGRTGVGASTKPPSRKDLTPHEVRMTPALADVLLDRPQWLSVSRSVARVHPQQGGAALAGARDERAGSGAVGIGQGAPCMGRGEAVRRLLKRSHTS